MADSDDLNTVSIGDYLLSIADGVVHAQEQLSLSRIASADGQQAIVYQIPRIDFELKMSIELSRTESKGEATLGPGGIGASLLKVRPADVNAGGGNTSRTGAISTVKGSFVAVPAQGGRAPPVVSISLAQVDPLKLEITVDVRTTLNEAVAGVDVQFNIDRDLSLALNRQAALLTGPHAGTLLERAIVRTGSDGRAKSSLIIADQEPTNASVAVVIDVAGRTETVIYRRTNTAP